MIKRCLRLAMKDEPLISIIVPVYNVEKYLYKCVDSIISQTYKNIEIILVDDGSPDRCGDICDRYAETDSRVKVIHKKNGGLSDARNVGIDIAKGEFISFIDSDDFVSKYFIEILHRCLVENDADISWLIHGVHFKDGDDDSVKFMNSDDDFSCKSVLSDEAIKRMFYQRIPTGAPWRLYKKAIFNELSFPVGYLYEDAATTYKACMLAEKIVLVDANAYAYRIRANSIIRMKFDERKLIAIDISKALYRDICKVRPKLKKAAASRAFALNYTVFLQVPKTDKSSMLKLWTEIKKYRKTILTDMSPNVRFKNRAGAVISYLGMNASWEIGRKYIGRD